MTSMRNPIKFFQKWDFFLTHFSWLVLFYFFFGLESQEWGGVGGWNEGGVRGGGGGGVRGKILKFKS